MLTRRRLLAAAPLAAAHSRPHPPLAAVPISRMQLPWWRERHEAKLAEIRRRGVDLVFLGDSITQNYEKSAPPDWQNFRPVWDRFYGDRHAVNLGFSGDATSHLLWRIENGEIDGIEPKVALILIGANNLGRLHWPADDDIAGIQAVIGATRKHLRTARILLLGILPSERSEWATRTTESVNRSLAQLYEKSPESGVTFLDIGGVFMRQGKLDRSLFYDPLLTPPEAPLHPTAEGQQRMAAAIEPTLAKLMGDRNHAVG
jgi:lysophospholipase L1-like esterase